MVKSRGYTPRTNDPADALNLAFTMSQTSWRLSAGLVVFSLIMSSNQTQTESVSQKGCVAILNIEKDGKFRKNMLPAEWRAADLMQRYVVASNPGMVISAVTVLRGAEWTLSPIGYQAMVTDYADLVRVPCDMFTVRDKIVGVVGNTPTLVILSSAVAVRPFPGAKLNWSLAMNVTLNADVYDRFEIDGEEMWFHPKLYPQVDRFAPELTEAIRIHAARDAKHEHHCQWCACVYTHEHVQGHLPHKQREKQCPNPFCSQYGTDEELARVSTRVVKLPEVHRPVVLENRKGASPCRCGVMRVAVPGTEHREHVCRFDPSTHIEKKDLIRHMSFLKNVEFWEVVQGALEERERVLLQAQSGREELPGLEGESDENGRGFDRTTSIFDPLSHERESSGFFGEPGIEKVTVTATNFEVDLLPGGSWFNNPFAGIRESKKNVDDMVSDVRQTATAATSAITKIDRISTMVESSVTLIRNFVGGVGEKASLALEYLTPGKIVEGIMILVDLFNGNMNTLGVVSLITRIANFFGVIDEVARVLLRTFSSGFEFLCSFFRKESTEREERAELEAQSRAGEAGFMSLLTAFIGTCAIGKLPSEKDAKRCTELMRTFNFAVPAMKNVSSLFEHVLRVLPTCLQNWVRVLCPSDDVFCGLLGGEELSTWIQKADLLLDPKRDKTLGWDLEFQDEILVHQTAGVEMARVYASALKSESSRLFDLLKERVVKLTKLAADVRDMRGADGSRPTPALIYLAGPPKFGKSLLSTTLTELLVPEEVPQHRKRHQMSATDEFMSGYDQHYILQMDDFFQAVASKDVETIFSLVSNATYYPNLPSLESRLIGKKGTPFTSPVILVCSNVLYPYDPAQIRSKEALLRRRLLTWEMVPKECCVSNYKEGMKNMDKRPNSAGFREDWSHMVFRLWDSVNPDVPSVDYTYEKFLEKCYVDCQHHLKKEKETIAEKKDDPIMRSVRARLQAQSGRSLPWLRSLERAKTAPLVEEAAGRAMSRMTVASIEKMFADAGVAVEAGAEVPLDAKTKAILVEEMAAIAKRRETWMSKHPRLKASLQFAGIAALAGVSFYSVWSYLNTESEKKKVELVLESNPERTKFKRGHARKQKMIVESGEQLSMLSGKILHTPEMAEVIDEVLNYRTELRLKPESVSAEYTHRVYERVQEVNKDLTRLSPESFSGWISPRGLARARAQIEDFVSENPEAKSELIRGLIEMEDLVAKRNQRELTQDEITEGVNLFRRLMSKCHETFIPWPDVGDRIIDAIEEKSPGHFTVKPVMMAEGANAIETSFAQRLLKESVETPKLKIESSTDPNSIDVLNYRVVPAMVQMVREDGNAVCGWMLKGTIVLIPRHFLMVETPTGAAVIDSNSVIKVRDTTGVTTNVRFDARKVQVIKGLDGKIRDQVLYDFGSRMRNYPDSMKCIMKSSTAQRYNNFPGNLVVFPTGAPSAKTVTLDNVEAWEKNGEYEIAGERVDLDAHTAWTYTADTVPGDCGAILLAVNKLMPEKVIGMHVAGIVGQRGGTAEMLIREEIEEAMKAFPQQVSSTRLLTTEFGPIENARIALNSQMFHVMGTLPDKQCPIGPTKTRIIPSPIQGEIFPVQTAPAALHPWDERLPEEYLGVSMLKRGCEKFGSPSAPLEIEMVDKARDFVGETLEAATGRFEGRVLTIDEAINGVPEKLHYDALDMNTSSGWPYALRKPAHLKGKRFLFKGEPGAYQINDEELAKNVEERLVYAKIGERVPSLWTTCLKDERRPIDKIWKPRLFVFSPVDLTIVTRMYTLAFSAAMLETNCEHGMAPGMDVHSWQWDRLAKKLAKTSNRGFGGDYGNYDGTLHSELIWATCDIMNAWYRRHDREWKLEDDLVRKTLFSEFIHTWMICGNSVLEKHSGNPSGNPLTTLINGIVNKLEMSVVWQKLAPEELRDLVFFAVYVAIIVYGDDNVLAVKKEVESWFNMLTVAACLKTMGMEYTPPDKDSALSGNKPLYEWSFLKHGFHETEAGHVLPITEKRTMEELTNWVTDTGEPWLQLQENMNDALSFAFFTDFKEPGYFKELRDKMLECGYKHGKHLMLLNYDTFYRQYAKKGQVSSLAFYPNGRLELWNDHRVPLKAQSGRSNPEPHNQGGETGEETMVSEEKVGVTNIQQSEPVSVSRVDVAMSHPAAEEVIKEVRWTMENTVEKEFLIANLLWATTDASGSVLANYNIPFDCLSSTIAHDPFRLFCFWRGEVCVKFSVHGTKFHNGRLCVTYYPMISNNLYNSWQKLSKPSWTVNPHVMLDPSVNTIGVLEVPFVTSVDWLNLREQGPLDTLGLIAVQVLNPLQIGAGGSTNVNIAVTVSFRKSEFHIPLPPAITRTSDRDIVAIEERANKMLESVRKSKAKRAALVAQMGNQYSRVTNNNISGTMTTTEGNFAQSDEIGHGAASGNKTDVSVPMPMDKPNINIAPIPVVRSPIGYFANSENLQFAERLMLHPGEMDYTTKEDFTSGEDECSIRYLTSIQCYDRTISWNTGQPAGTLLDHGFLSPLGVYITNVGLKGTEVKTMTMFDFVSAKFDFWRGSLMYRLQAIASMYHTGSLFFGVHYGVTGASDITEFTLGDAISTAGFYINLNSEKHDFTFGVPYECARKMLRVPNGIVGGSNNNEVMGIWSLWIVNELVAPEGVATEVPINMWHWGGDDYQLLGTGMNNATMVAFSPWMASGTGRSEPQGARVKLVAQSGQDVQWVYGKKSSLPPLRGFDAVNSVLEVCKRMTPLESLRFDASVVAAAITPDWIGDTNTWPLSTYNTSTIFGRMRDSVIGDDEIAISEDFGDRGGSLFGWFYPMYRASRGTYRLRLRYDPGTSAATYAVLPDGTSVPITQTVAVSSIPLSIGFSTQASDTVGQGMNVTAGRGLSNVWMNTLDFSDVQSTRVNAVGVPGGTIPITGTGPSRFLQMAIPLAVGDSHANYVDVEIPYISQYKYIMNTLSIGLEAFDKEMYNTGSVGFKQPGLCRTMVPGATPTDPPRVAFYGQGRTEIWGAIGDEFRFGILLGVPPVTWFNANQGVDSW